MQALTMGRVSTFTRSDYYYYYRRNKSYIFSVRSAVIGFRVEPVADWQTLTLYFRLFSFAGSHARPNVEQYELCMHLVCKHTHNFFLSRCVFG